ncbi:hypothetical protein Tco_0077242 [Tanacetum coccineum]
MILAAQSKVFKQENVLAERLHGLDPQMERKRDKSVYFMDRIWVLLVGSVMDEAHASSVGKRKALSGERSSKKLVVLGVKPLVFEREIMLLLKEYAHEGHSGFGRWVNASLHVPLDEINVDKTLRFVEEPIENSDREVKSEDEDNENDADDVSDEGDDDNDGNDDDDDDDNDDDKQEGDDTNDDDEETDSDRTKLGRVKIPILDQSTTEFYKKEEENIDDEGVIRDMVSRGRLITVNQIKPRPKDYSFKEWLKVKIGHTNVSEAVKSAVLNEWFLDSFDVESYCAGICNDPYSRNLEEYKAVFDNEIEQLANEYKLRIGKKGYILDDIWEKM